MISRLHAALLLVSLFSACATKQEVIVGVKIYELKSEIDTLLRKWEEVGVNTVFASTELTANTDFRMACRAKGIKFFTIFPVFYNPSALASDSSLFAVTDDGRLAKDEWVQFVCPSRISYRKQQIDSIAKLVRNFEPDGVSLDFIRQFVFWEKVYSDRDPETIRQACFCNSCVFSFLEREEIKIPDTIGSVPGKAQFLLQNYPAQWHDYRTDLIASMVREITDKVREVKPGTLFNLHAVPWREHDFEGAVLTVAAQDLNKISPYVDFISPMCYSHMLRRDAEWISSVVRDMDRRVPGKILPSIQANESGDNYAFSIDQFDESVRQSLRAPSLGVVLWSWPLLEQDQRRVKRIKDLSSERQAE